jgi:hypothetical protein
MVPANRSHQEALAKILKPGGAGLGCRFRITRSAVLMTGVETPVRMRASASRLRAFPIRRLSTRRWPRSRPTTSS